MGKGKAKHRTKKKRIAQHPEQLNLSCSFGIDKFGRGHYWEEATCSGVPFLDCKNSYRPPPVIPLRGWLLMVTHKPRTCCMRFPRYVGVLSGRRLGYSNPPGLL
jgi:hypothetical protein